MWCWRRLWRVPWTARRSNQSILKDFRPEYSLEGLTLKMKLQYFGHVKNWLIRKDPDAGKDWKWEEKGTTENEMVRWHHRLNGHWVNSGSWWWTGRTGVLWSMQSQRVGHNWVTELNWTNANLLECWFWAICGALRYWCQLTSWKYRFEVEKESWIVYKATF